LVPFWRLMRFYLFIVLTALHKVLGEDVANCRRSTHLRMRQGKRRVMYSMRKCGLRERTNPVRRPTSGERAGGAHPIDLRLPVRGKR
jgi:hypothetical protein